MKWICKTWYTHLWNSKRPYTSWSNSKNKNELRPEIEKRIMHANRAHQALILYKDPISTQGRKIKFSKTLIRPVATYRAKTWTLNEDIAQWMAALERKDLRKSLRELK